MIRFATAIAALAIGVTACAEPSATPATTAAGGIPSATPSPTIGATPTDTPNATRTPPSSPSPTATPTTTTPTATPPAEQRFDALEDGDVLVVITDNLVVRSEPEVSDSSEIFDQVLQPGAVVRYRGGPVEGSGYEWIEGRVIEPPRREGPLTGWIAVGDNDSDESWLARLRPEGEGWRLLGEGTEGMAYTLGVALGQSEYEDEWATAGASGQPPSVDFDDEVVVRFTHVVSSTCTYTEHYGIGVDRQDSIVFSAASRPRPSEDVDPDDDFACTTDARPHAFVVAIDRDVLPAGEVRFRLERGADDEVALDLR